MIKDIAKLYIVVADMERSANHSNSLAHKAYAEANDEALVEKNVLYDRYQATRTHESDLIKIKYALQRMIQDAE